MHIVDGVLARLLEVAALFDDDLGLRVGEGDAENEGEVGERGGSWLEEGRCRCVGSESSGSGRER